MQHVLYEYLDDPNCGAVTRMSYTSSLFVCSFSLLGEGQHTLSSSGNHNMAEVKGHEGYGTLKTGSKNV